MRGIYGTWGLHDELGDSVELTEELANHALDRLLDFRRQGWRFDVFLIDYPWFDPDGDLTVFRRRSWRNNGEDFRRRLRESGIDLGLWFPVSGRSACSPAWAASQAADGTHYSLAEGPFMEGLLGSMRRAVGEWGARFIKLDFAAFSAVPAGSPLSPQDAYRIATSRFLGELASFRATHPEVEVIAHCGWFPNGDGERLGGRMGFGADPAWLGGLDRLFAGDPHIFDGPSTDLPTNLRLFQDRQVWRLHQDGFPLRRIDDHGVIVARTNTAMYVGAGGFPSSWLASLGRGPDRAMLYGDPSLLSETAVAFGRSSMDLYSSAYAMGLETRTVGDGEPGLAPWHGFLTGGGMAGLLAIANAHWEPTQAALPLAGLGEAGVVFANDSEVAAIVEDGVLQVTLPAESFACIGLGAFADVRLEHDDSGRRVRIGRFVKSAAGHRAELAGGPGEFLILSQASVADDRFVGGRRAFPFGREDERAGKVSQPKCHQVVLHKTDARVVSQLPGVPVWSGTPWVVSRIAADGPWTCLIEADLPADVELQHRVYDCRGLYGGRLG